MFITLTINTTKTKTGYRTMKKPSNDWRKSLNSKKRSFKKRVSSSLKNSLKTSMRSLVNEFNNKRQNLKTI